jgi:DNA replication protein DnaC
MSEAIVDASVSIQQTLTRFSGIVTQSEEDYTRIEMEKEARKQHDFITGQLTAIPKRFVDSTFDNYELSEETVVATKQIKIIEALRSGGSVVLYGRNGTGKTRLAFAAMHFHIEQGKSTRYVISLELFDEIRHAFNDHGVSRIIEKYARFDYLVIDEVDKSYGSATEVINLFRIVNERYNRLLPTFMITNAGRNDETKDGVLIKGVINSIGRSPYERIVKGEGKAFEMDWDSYRRRKPGRSV